MKYLRKPSPSLTMPQEIFQMYFRQFEYFMKAPLESQDNKLEWFQLAINHVQDTALLILRSYYDDESSPTWLRQIFTTVNGAVAPRPPPVGDLLPRWISHVQERPDTTPEQALLFLLQLRRMEKPRTLKDLRSADESVASDFVQREFKGPGVLNLKNHLQSWERRYRADRYYAKVMGILQSSGFGKTRLVYELSKQVLGLLICVRRDDSAVPSGVSAPPADGKTRELLLSPARIQGYDDFEMVQNIACFLAAVAIQMARQVQQASCSPRQHQPSNVQNEAAWSSIVAQVSHDVHHGIEKDRASEEFQDTNRNLFMQALIRQAKYLIHRGKPMSESDLVDSEACALIDQLPNGASHHWLEMRKREPEIKTNAEFFSKHLKVYFNLDLDRQNPSSSDCLEAVLPIFTPRRQSSSVRQQSKPLSTDTTDPIFFLALDECNTLGPERLCALRRFWSFLFPRRQWILLIDTQSSITTISGYEATQASARFRDNGFRLVNPFVNLSIDNGWWGLGGGERDSARINLRDLVGKPFRQLESYASHYGRPLWADPQKPGPRYGPLSLWLAGVKLLCSEYQWPQQTLVEPRFREKVLAVLSQRIALRLHGMQGNTDTRTLRDELVARHMRRIARISINGEMAETFAPSEPVLSAAACYLLRFDPLQRWKDCISMLHQSISHTIIEPGKDGEEMVRILISMAIDLLLAQKLLPFPFKLADLDRVMIKSILSEEEAKPERAAILDPVAVWAWLDTLIGFTTIPGSEAEGSKARGVGPRPLPQTPSAVAKAWMQCHSLNLTHFAKLDRLYHRNVPIPRALLAEGWLRQCAFIGVSNQDDWDILIPVHRIDELGSELRVGDTPFDPMSLSYILVQVKNRHNHSTRPSRVRPLDDSEVPSTAKRAGVMSSSRGSGRPVFSREASTLGSDLARGGDETMMDIDESTGLSGSRGDPALVERTSACDPCDKRETWFHYEAPGISNADDTDPVQHVDHLWMFFNLRARPEVLWDSQSRTSPLPRSSESQPTSHHRHAVLLSGFAPETFSLLHQIDSSTKESLTRLLGVVASEDDTEALLRRTDPPAWSALRGQIFVHVSDL
ncbi:hypothetical protein IE53DRAFT_274241 [Violaceomyces palustris]|uniref:Uncharacterized protein n=1 Tax=Violaceomyces palustris TaxID=1673888 RepID=A0ACD0P323_9BASI|nr:hypothetical protein IE53DRAFT_274241 [Violaceomyces palustris]